MNPTIYTAGYTGSSPEALAELADLFDALVSASLERPRILLCACQSPADCHRHHELVPPLRRRGITVTHIYQPTRELIDADELSRALREDTDYECVGY